MATVVFTFEGETVKIQCSRDAKMRDICNKYAAKINKNLDSLLFLYSGVQMDFELTFEEHINIIDKGRGEMNVLVENLGEEEPPKTEEKMNLNDLKLKIIKIEHIDKLKGLKLQLESTINLNDINIIKDKIKLINTSLDDIIKDAEKNIIVKAN